MKPTSVIHKIVFTIFAIVLFIAAWNVFEKLKVYGLNIASIKSVGGKTLEEAYYQQVGFVYIYLAQTLRLIAAGISGIILCITYKG